MPIPPTKLVQACQTLEELHQLMALEPYRWEKVIEFDWIDRAQNDWRVTKWRVIAENLEPCGCDDRSIMTYVRQVSHGVVRTCCGCRKTMGMLPLDTKKGTPGVINLGSRRCTFSEMEQYIKKTGQELPYNVDFMKQLDQAAHLR